MVRGFLKEPNIQISDNFHRSLFCYFQGNFVMARSAFGGHFFTFRVDSVISGTFYNSINEVSKPPFNIMVGLFNEAVVLDSREYYTLQLRRFPHTNYFYVDSLSLVYPNEQFWERLAKHNERHQQNINTIHNGTSRERAELLEKLIRGTFPGRYDDYRYIPHILPHMTSTDSVINLWLSGRFGFEEEVKDLYSYHLFRYLDQNWLGAIPRRILPDRRTTDSIGWHKWYENLFSQQVCFRPVQFATSQSEIVIPNINTRCWRDRIYGFRYFIPDMPNRMIHFAALEKAYSFNIDTGEFTESSFLRNWNILDTRHFNRVSYAARNDKIIKYDRFNEGVGFWQLNNGVFYRQDDKVIPLNLRFDERENSFRIFPHLIVDVGEDFFVFTSQNHVRDCIETGYNFNRLKAGKINRKGEWIIEPKIIYKKTLGTPTVSSPNVYAFSFYQSDKNETTFVFSDRMYGRTSRHTNSGENWGAVIVYRLNANLEITNSVVLKMEFPHTHFFFRRTQLLKNGNTYLLLTETTGGGVNMRIHYRLLNNDLSPKTDFIQLLNKRIPANTNTNWHLLANPITTSEGFLISWNDYELTENLTRSVLIDATSGRQSDIINISNQRISDIFNIEFDENNVDIFIVDTDGNLIRKRINKSEFGL